MHPDAALKRPATYRADRGDVGERLDLVLRRHLAGLETATRSRIQSWIEEGLVTVNGSAVRRVASRVAAGDSVTVLLPPAPPRRTIAADDTRVEILYEDDHLLAVNKPAGIVAHPTHAHAGGTLLNVLVGRARNWPAGHRPSLVNRLDKLTSGVVLVAKTPAVHAALQRALASRTVEKDYLAIVYGRPPLRGTIDLKLQRDTVDRRRVVASAARGTPSVTRFERMSQVRVGQGATLSLVRCRLVTGRTHQIRVHLASSGWPIVGDPVYGEARWRDVADSALRDALRTFPRQALHAERLTFAHPVGGAEISIDAPVPDDLAALLDRVARRGSRIGR